jgi:hypothetical protein
VYRVMTSSESVIDLFSIESSACVSLQPFHHFRAPDGATMRSDKSTRVTAGVVSARADAGRADTLLNNPTRDWLIWPFPSLLLLAYSFPA